MKTITVVISTIGKRPKKLFACLESIKNGSYKSFNLLVLQQTEKKMKLPDWVQTKKIPNKGVSFSKNKAIELCETELIAFIDDDCLADKNWLKNIVDDFKNQDVQAVYGRVLPYLPEKNKNKVCPSYMKAEKRRETRELNLENTHLGIGSNMAFRRNVFDQLGGFVENLGPGTKSKAAEDLDLLFRLLDKKQLVVFNPKSIVHHNNWLSQKDNRDLYADYYRGIFSAYGFHMFFKNKVAAEVLNKYWQGKKKLIVSEFKHPLRYVKSNMIYDFKDLFNFFIGLKLAFYQFLKKRFLSSVVEFIR